MKKSDRITALVREHSGGAGPAPDPHYAGYFTCFNAARYYEAHDVLEHLWLRCDDGNALFYKGLIQIAGAFVHLQKQFLHPAHPKHGRRLRPAARLFRLGVKNLAPFAPRHLGLDVGALSVRCSRIESEIIASGFLRNPWNPGDPPQIALSVES
jgi:hypothetical protein